MDGTRTYLVGELQVAIIDPGPDVEDHLRALSGILDSAQDVRILLTHQHSDHAGGAPRLAAELGVPLFAPSSYSPSKSSENPDDSLLIQTLREGDTIPTDQGELGVLEIPGHSQDHLGFAWRDEGAVFVGDLILGKGKTTWVGEYLGCVKDYLRSLDKVEALDASILYPTHGPPVRTPKKTLQRFRRHRLDRMDEVQSVRNANPEASAVELAELIYGGTIPEKLVKAARSGVEAALHHLDGEGSSA